MNLSMLLVAFFGGAVVIRYLAWLCAEIRLAPVAVETSTGLRVAADDDAGAYGRDLV